MIRSGFSVFLMVAAVLHSFAQIAGTDELITHRPPSDNFVSINLQAYKGLPRFGVVDSYKNQVPSTNADPRSNAVRPVRGGGRNPGQLKKNKMVNTGRINFSLLVNLKYLTPFMEDLDKDRLTFLSKSLTEKQSNSAYLQRFLLNQVAPNLCLDRACKNANQGKNEFERQRNYKTFVNTCIDPLLEWCQDVFKNDELSAYHVSALNIGGNYDFGNKGYWVHHYLSLNDIFPFKQGGRKRVTFEPVKPYESQLLGKLARGKSINFFLPMDEQTAERFKKEGINRLYLVKKIKLQHSDKGMDAPTDPIDFNYSHESSDMEIYTEEALVSHFRTLSLDNLILKN
ncbi:MAG: hypothetical protein NXH90_12790 [Flavobacteriaceae bacterium]|nr:hypothetical protein [Flavobacteriaceae bacterium]